MEGDLSHGTRARPAGVTNNSAPQSIPSLRKRPAKPPLHDFLPSILAPLPPWEALTILSPSLAPAAQLAGLVKTDHFGLPGKFLTRDKKPFV